MIRWVICRAIAIQERSKWAGWHARNGAREQPDTWSGTLQEIVLEFSGELEGCRADKKREHFGMILPIRAEPDDAGVAFESESHGAMQCFWLTVGKLSWTKTISTPRRVRLCGK
jgi:hypothetical protein